MDSHDGLVAPRGARDLLPPACRRRRELVRGLVDTFERWGYEPVATPLVESFETLGRGLSEADRARCVRFIEAGSGELVALRSDVTPQIARMIARRLGGELAADAVHRFCYAADVVRQPTAEREQTEHHQVCRPPSASRPSTTRSASSSWATPIRPRTWSSSHWPTRRCAPSAS